MASPQLPVSLFPVTVLIPSSSVGFMSFFWILKISSNVLILLPTPPQSWSHAGGLVLNHTTWWKQKWGFWWNETRSLGALVGNWVSALPSLFLIVPSATYSVPSRTHTQKPKGNKASQRQTATYKIESKSPVPLGCPPQVFHYSSRKLVHVSFQVSLSLP